MEILNSQQVNYCDLLQESEQGEKYLLGIFHKNKIHTKDTLFPPEEKQLALESCRNKFLEAKGKVSYLLVEDTNGFAIWQENKQAKVIDKDLSSDKVERINLEELVRKMRDIGGITIQDRYYRLKLYPKSFIGSEAVTWFEINYQLSTEEAVKLGQRLIDANVIHHVVDGHQFANEFLFYRFYWDEQ